MSKKNYAIVLVYACLTLVLGLVFLFDAVDIAFDGVIERWYLALLLYLAGGTVAMGIIKNAPIYYTIASIFAGVFLSLSIGRPFGELWALIPISISIGMMFTHWLSHGRLRYFKFAIIMFILSVIMLVGSLTHSWRYVVPAELIAVGVISIIYVSVKLSKTKNNKLSSEEEDYHVRPTKEINKEEDL